MVWNMPSHGMRDGDWEGMKGIVDGGFMHGLRFEDDDVCGADLW